MMNYKVNEQQIENVDLTENDLNALLGIFDGLLQKYTKPTCTHPKRVCSECTKEVAFSNRLGRLVPYT